MRLETIKTFYTMISRRILRIKVLQTIYSYYQGEGELKGAQKELAMSIDRSYDLYFYLLQLCIEVADYCDRQQEAAKLKYMATLSELNPNKKFVHNKLIEQLRINETLQSYLVARGLSWAQLQHVVKSVFNDLSLSDTYKAYMAEKEESYAKDKAIVAYLIEHVILENSDFFDALEEQSVYWIDTVEFFAGMALRTIDRYKASHGADAKMLPKYKNDEDAQFADQLLLKAVASGDRYRELISENADNWDLERIALLDILLIQVALAEVEQFPEIPLRVTFNEYIEIAKNYSTEKSPLFINGVLDKIVQKLRDSGDVIKPADIPPLK
ncbi:MAG: transcription antitermination factor NusB [Bacteroidales bacterium]|nr:transcription antitermination factor NusB [Bacteroidales bacterium]